MKIQTHSIAHRARRAFFNPVLTDEIARRLLPLVRQNDSERAMRRRGASESVALNVARWQRAHRWLKHAHA